MKVKFFANLFNGAFVVGMLSSCDRYEAADAQLTVKPEPNELTVYTWEEYFDESTLEAFEQKTGAKVHYATFEHVDEMEARLKSEQGKYDVIVADDSALDRMKELKLVRSLDHSLLPNLANLHARFRQTPFDPGNSYTVPYTWGTTLVAYRTDKIENPGPSWGLLFDPSLEDRVMMYNDRREAITVPLLYLGYPLNSEDPAHLREARDLLLGQVRDLGVKFGNDTKVREALASGEVWAAMCYSGDALRVAEESGNIDFFIPEEGAPLWVDCYAITQDTQAPNLAHRFIDHMLEAKQAAANINYAYYASPNAAAEEFIDEELLEDARINPAEEVLARCQWYVKQSATLERMMNGIWNEVHQEHRQQNEVAGGVGEPVGEAD